MVETLYLEMNGIVIVVTFDIEDFYHFVIVCPHFADLRKTYIKKYYYERPSVFKLLDLLQTQDKNSYVILFYI